MGLRSRATGGEAPLVSLASRDVVYERVESGGGPAQRIGRGVRAVTQRTRRQVVDGSGDLAGRVALQRGRAVFSVRAYDGQGRPQVSETNPSFPARARGIDSKQGILLP